MRRLFLLGTALCVATGAFAFGGIGIGPWQRHKNQGVDVIGIHIDPSKKKANINIIDGDDTQKQCALGWTLNTESNECECPEERTCGETCCGEGNICVDGNKCCYQDLEGNVDEGMCCNATESLGYANVDGVCCGVGEISYVKLHSPEDGIRDTACCNGKVYMYMDDTYDGYYMYAQGCCNAGLKEVKDHKSDKFYHVCGDCVDNEDCDENEFCDLQASMDAACYPAHGVCKPIESAETINVIGLGNVVVSHNRMSSWWAANNWCTAQGLNLIPIEDFACYNYSAHELVRENSGKSSACCKENQYCSYMDENEDHVSSIFADLKQKLGHNWWMASDFSPDSECGKYVASGRYVSETYAGNTEYHAVCK